MKDVAVLAAGGAVGQRFVQRLNEHPLFRAMHLVGSPEKKGQRYADATRWMLDDPIPESVGDLRLTDVEALLDGPPGIALSALPSGTAGPVETRLARAGWQVFTNASDHRMDPTVPLLIPEVNADHLALAARQSGPGRIIANGNCGAIIFILGLAPIHANATIRRASIVTQQALSGAGYPGVSALDITDNVLTYLPGEEEKLCAEPLKTLGKLGRNGIEPARFPIHATATRVPVRDGHTVHVHLELAEPVSARDVQSWWTEFVGPDDVAHLPSAPNRPVHLFVDPHRPQPRLDRDLEGGMSVAVGRLRVHENHVQFTVLGSNTVRGAAGQSLLNAEYAVSKADAAGMS